MTLPASTEFPSNDSRILSSNAASAEGEASQGTAPLLAEASPQERLVAELKKCDNAYRHACALVQQFLEKHKFFALFGQMRFRSKEEGDEYQRLVIDRYNAGEKLQAAMVEWAQAKVKQ